MWKHTDKYIFLVNWIVSEDIQKVTSVKLQDTLDAEAEHGIMNTAKAIYGRLKWTVIRL